ncbi:MAG: nucleotidyltransferase domain-containing protein [Spirochaetaceae bacterium]|nr:nucleotidyltransferase domain-containing protein [Spirochaetaceae bacterium]
MDLQRLPVKYRNDIKKAVKLLKNEGCKAVYLFGSLANGNYRDNSDIDLGIRGLPPNRFIHAYGELDSNIRTPTDLVDFDYDSDFYSMLDSIHEVVQIG